MKDCCRSKNMERKKWMDYAAIIIVILLLGSLFVGFKLSSSKNKEIKKDLDSNK